MALGAGAGRTFRLVVGGALKVVLVGVALGLGGAALARATGPPTFRRLRTWR